MRKINIKSKEWVVGISALIVFAIAAYLIAFRFPKETYLPKHPDWITYTNNNYGFSIEHPKNFTIDPNFINETLGPGKELPGVLFNVPKEEYGQGTNLNEAKISVEVIKNSTSCSPLSFLPDAMQKDINLATIEGVEYGQARSTGAAAGNIYKETVYARLEGTRCFGFRLLVHTGNIGNYPKEAKITEFFPGNLEKIFTDMISTVHYNINVK